MGDIALRGNKLTRGPHGHGPKPFLNKPGQAQGTHGGKARGGRIRRPRKSSTHSKVIPTMAAEGGRAGHALGHTAGRLLTKTLERLGGGKEGKPHSTKKGRIASGVRRIKRGLSARQRDKWGDLPPWKRDPKRLPKQPWESKAEGGRIGLNKGGKSKPWGAGPKPGTHDYLLQQLHKRKGKATGNIVKGAGRAAKPRTLKPNPRKARPGASSDPKKPWPPKHRDLLRRFPKMPQPHKSPGDKPYIPMPKHDPNKPKKYQPAATGGRMGFKKGGSDKKWMQKVSASIKKRGTKGKCTPITKPGCTGRAKALAKTFKKIAARRKG